MEMKKIYLLITTLLAVAATQQLSAESLPAEQMQQRADTTLLSEWVDGNYLVRRYKINSAEDEAQYNLKYSVSASKLNSLLAGNSAELDDLDKMMTEIKNGENMHIKRIEITGYASPDGDAMGNEALALSRAQKFRSMLESRYALLSNYPIQVMADAEQWDNCNEAVVSSAISDKDKVLSIIDSATSEASKEQQLKRMPAVWSVFRNQILPAMRRVEMTVYYDVEHIVEVRTLIEKPKPAPSPKPQPAVCPCRGVVIDEWMGIIVDLSDPNAIY